MNTRSTFLLNLIVFAFTSSLFAQGIIVNEGCNGTTGNREYFELLVIGSTTQTTGTVNLGGWIIDDNNSTALNTSGITTGHIRLKSSCFSAVPIGSIIIIYNAKDKDAFMPVDDPTDANGDLVYILPHTSTCLEGSTATNYNSGTYTSPLALNAWESLMALGNSNDVFQVRKPDGSVFHAIAYGSNAKSVALPSELGGGNTIIISGSASTASLNYNCGALRNASSYQKVTISTTAGATPGAPNSADNAILIENIRQGTFDYSDWSNPANCQPPVLPLTLLSFEAKPYSLLQNILTWELAKVDPQSFVYIERSKDAINFEPIAVLPLQETMQALQYTYEDNTPYYTTYYRLRFSEPNAPSSYTATKVVTHQAPTQNAILNIYPNPTNDYLNILLERDYGIALQYQIIDNLGRVLQSGTWTENNIQYTLPVQHLNSGLYYLNLASDTETIAIQRFIKY